MGSVQLRLHSPPSAFRRRGILRVTPVFFASISKPGEYGPTRADQGGYFFHLSDGLSCVVGDIADGHPCNRLGTVSASSVPIAWRRLG